MEHTVFKYFPGLTQIQREQFLKLYDLYPEWNEKINVISRKDIENLETNHVLHSLAIGKYINFTDGSTVLDFGTGGGFPGIPLAILFPNVKFHLVDRTGKKIKVATEIANAIGLRNVTFQHGDVAECKDRFDFVVSRAVMPQTDLLKICKKNISNVQKNALPNGLITLKGGDIEAEIKSVRHRSEVIDISQYFTEPYFDTKKIIYTKI